LNIQNLSEEKYNHCLIVVLRYIQNDGTVFSSYAITTKCTRCWWINARSKACIPHPTCACVHSTSYMRLRAFHILHAL